MPANLVRFCISALIATMRELSDIDGCGGGQHYDLGNAVRHYNLHDLRLADGECACPVEDDGAELGGVFERRVVL